MKQYPKTYGNISKDLPKTIYSRLGSAYGSIDDLVDLFRVFYKEAHPLIFSIIVKEMWCEQQVTYNGVRRTRRHGNGVTIDGAFSKFLRMNIGATQKPLTTGIAFTAIASYIPDFFPKFIDFNPFTEPEYFKFPYKNIFLDHLMFVSKVHNRMEMLEYAEKTSMPIDDFQNWSYNWVMNYNEETGVEMYGIDRGRRSWVPTIIRNNKVHSKKKHG